MRALRGKLLPALLPALPILIAAGVLAWREADGAVATERTAERAAAATTPEQLAPHTLLPGRKLCPTADSAVRFRIGDGAGALCVSADVAAGSLETDAAGLPVRLALTVELATLHGIDRREIEPVAWDVLGVHKRGRLEFHGVRQRLVQSEVTGVSTVFFAGTVRLGRAARFLVIPFRIATIDGERARILGYGRASGVDYGLPGGQPFRRGGDSNVVIVWDVLFAPASRP